MKSVGKFMNYVCPRLQIFDGSALLRFVAYLFGYKFYSCSLYSHVAQSFRASLAYIRSIASSSCFTLSFVGAEELFHPQAIKPRLHVLQVNQLCTMTSQHSWKTCVRGFRFCSPTNVEFGLREFESVDFSHFPTGSSLILQLSSWRRSVY